MARTITIHLDELEYKELKAMKGKHTWKTILISGCEYVVKQEK